MDHTQTTPDGTFSAAMMTHLLLLGLYFPDAASAGTLPCTPGSPAGVACLCDVRALRPLQGAVGIEEVRDKAEKIVAKPDKERQKLATDPIKVIRGPGGALFHHGSSSWRRRMAPGWSPSGAMRDRLQSAAYCRAGIFWSGLINDHLVRLADSEGKTITPQELPVSLAAMPDDPYRSLAWRVRKKDGFCRSTMPQKEFAEFIWADWFRTQPRLPADSVRASAKKMLPTALALARSTGAKDVPGYVGDKPPGFTCPDD